MSEQKIEVGILGATGMVGQQFVSVGASSMVSRDLAGGERTIGREIVSAAAPWRLAGPMPEAQRDRKVEACVPGRGPKIVFSALDASAADTLEHEFAAAGHVVLSNARSTAWIRSCRCSSRK